MKEHVEPAECLKAREGTVLCIMTVLDLFFGNEKEPSDEVEAVILALLWFSTSSVSSQCGRCVQLNSVWLPLCCVLCHQADFSDVMCIT